MYRTAIALLLTFLGGIYLAYSYQENKYEAKIAKERLAYQEAISKEKARGEAITATYVERLRAETKRTNDYGKQAVSMEKTSGSISDRCFVTYGFIRLFNDSARGTTSEPTSTDSQTSTVDLTTVLTTVIENHGKYREAASQVEAINIYFSDH